MNTEVTIQHTNSGVRFGTLGGKPSSPVPTLIVVGSDIESSLTDPEVNQVGILLSDTGYLCVALDLPCHGIARNEGESFGLDGWRERLEGNEDFVIGFTNDVTAVINHLISEGYTDPARIAIAGTSRGGFMGLHAMVKDKRIACGAAFAPLVEMTVLTELHALKGHELTSRLALANQADGFGGRPIWIAIGNNDERVGVDTVIAFTRKVVRASLARGVPAAVEIHIMHTEGHYTHSSAHQEAASWLAEKLAELPSAAASTLPTKVS